MILSSKQGFWPYLFSRPSPMDCYWYCGRSFCVHGYFGWSWSDMVRVQEGKMQKGHKTARKKVSIQLVVSFA